MNKILSDMPIYKGMFYIYESHYKKVIHIRPMSVDIMRSLLTGYNFANAYGSYYEQMPEGLKVLADAIRVSKIKLPYGQGLSLRQAYQVLTKIQEEGLQAEESFFKNEDFNRIKNPNFGLYDGPVLRMAEYVQWWWNTQNTLANSRIAELAREVGFHKSVLSSEWIESKLISWGKK